MNRRSGFESTIWPGRVVSWGFVALMLALQAGPAGADPWILTVRGNGTKLGETPLVVPLPTFLTHGKDQLKPAGAGTPVAAQTYLVGGKCYLAMVLDHMPAKGELTFSYESDSSADRPGTGIKFRTTGPNLEVLIRGEPFTVYRTDEPTKPYFYPVFGPTGAEFTRAFPIQRDVPGEDQDHFHHRSLWFTHGDVNGVDFWASDPANKPNPKFGMIHETSREVVAQGPAVGVLKTTDDWIGPDGKKVCEDERVVKFFNTKQSRVIDFDVTLKATAGPVTFGDTKEGMFGLRVASSMDVVKGKTRQAGRIINAEGVTDDAAWGKASPWVDYTGPVAGKAVGVAILNHPESFRYPTTWHVRTYGLFAANPFGYHDFGIKKPGSHVLPRGEVLRFRYRVILHEGDTDSAHVADAFKAYAEPPAVTLQRE